MSIFNSSRSVCKSFKVLPIIINSNRLRFPIRRFSGVHVNEIKIDVPWGHISGRHWNGSNVSRKPVICLHGWKDNASTFDRIMPLLIPSLDQYQFLCIDHPGHGLSSHYPAGMIYNLTDSFMWIRRVMKNFDWSTVSIIGHSFGGITGFIFASLHPTLVEQLITIDGLTPVIFSPFDITEMMPSMTDNFLRMDEMLINQAHPPTFTWDEIFQKILTSHMMGVNESACKTLMTRGVQESPVGSGRFRLSHDIRVQYLPITPLDNMQIEILAKNFKSGLLNIKALEGVNYMSTFLRSNIQGWIEKDNHKHVKFIGVEKATHHVHLVDPDLIYKHIIDFMQNPKC